MGVAYVPESNKDPRSGNPQPGRSSEEAPKRRLRSRMSVGTQAQIKRMEGQEVFWVIGVYYHAHF